MSFPLLPDDITATEDARNALVVTKKNCYTTQRNVR